MKFFGIWKLGIPKSAILTLIESIDEDQDGYLTLGEIKNLLKRYGKDCKNTLKFQFRK